MRKKLLIIVFLGIAAILSSQSVDSIKVEQTGDYIRIGYKILGSIPGQVYRVKVLSSINGGLNSELRSVSGDVGENVQGGKDEYFVVWDVLKDVQELEAAEFIVRAELTGDVVSNNGKQNNEETLKWSKKGFNLMLASEFPGPKAGFRIGYMRSFGLSFQFVYGKTLLKEEQTVIPILGPPTGTVSYEPDPQPSIGLDITKRIVNLNSFQMHLIAGAQRTRLIFYNSQASETPYQVEKVYGPEFGLACGIKNFAFSVLLTHFDPGQIEKSTDFLGVSPFTYISSTIGIRF